MKLAAYLADERMTYTEFARRIGAKGARTVERYAKNQRVPAKHFMERIAAETDGKVSPGDFFEVA